MVDAVTLRFVYGYDQLIAQFVAEMIPHCRRGFGECKTIGAIDDDGRLIAGLVYHNYDPEAAIIEISGAAITARWLTREMIARMHQYPFHQCECQMVAMRIPANNTRLLRQLAVYGYTFREVPRLFGRKRDGVIATLTFEDWVENRFNQRLQHHVEPQRAEAA